MTNLRLPGFSLPAVFFLVTAALLAPEARAQSIDVGISAVRAQRYGRPSLPNPNAGGGDLFGWVSAAGDFNGDGVDDLATGVPTSDGPSAAPVNECGAVVVRYGVARKGLAPGVAPTVLGQFVGPFNSAEAGDRFGWALAACNLNGDGYDDLVVGVPFETVTVGFNVDFDDAGMIEVYYGTSAGLVPPASTTRREVGDMINFPTAGTHFGEALACGDFDLDGYDDLVVGLPLRDLPSGASNAGRINFYWGSESGISSGALRFDQDSTGFDDSGESGDHFGEVLAAGDFDGDGFDDLAIGVPGEAPGSDEFDHGAVHLVYGSATGFETGSDRLFFESSFGQPNGNNGFGGALAVGNFDADDYDDLALGVPLREVSVHTDPGVVFEVFGSATGLDTARFEVLNQDVILAPGQAADHERFGSAVAAGDFDGDGADDLAVGSPGEAAGDGAVTVVMGLAGTGLTPAPNRHRQFHPGLEGFPGDASEPLVGLGERLAPGDFDGDGHADLAIGAPHEDESDLSAVGTVTVLYGALFADGFENGSMGGHWSDVQP